MVLLLWIAVFVCCEDILSLVGGFEKYYYY